MGTEIVYLGHSAVCVKTAGHILVFDYYKDSGGRAEDGTINLAELKSEGRRVLFLASHNHHDHYSRSIASLIAAEDCTYVLGDFQTGYPGCITMQPHETLDNEGVTIFTAASTDCGVCYLVSCDGVNIFHAGDNADWGDDDTDVSYYDEIDFLARKDLAIDIAFIPVCYFNGQRSESMTRGALYAMERLSPEITFPIHGNGREYLYREFYRDAEESGVRGKIVCFERVGEQFNLCQSV